MGQVTLSNIPHTTYSQRKEKGRFACQSKLTPLSWNDNMFFLETVDDKNIKPMGKVQY